MTNALPLPNLVDRLRTLGATEVLVKHLAPNDNSKNQIYLAGDISSLGLIPTNEIVFSPGASKKPGAHARGPIFRAGVDLWWLTADGRLSRAPNSKLILYPQYSEVRLSGFLLGSDGAPSELLDINKRGREPGRVLVMAALPDRRVVAAVFASDTSEAAHGEQGVAAAWLLEGDDVRDRAATTDPMVNKAWLAAGYKTTPLYRPPAAAPGAVDAVLAALGHAPKTDERCTARVKETSKELRKPGPPGPPKCCCLKAGHEGPHKCNFGGMSWPAPFRDSDVVEFREPIMLCAKCRTRWPCPDAEKVTAALATKPDGPRAGGGES